MKLAYIIILLTIFALSVMAQSTGQTLSEPTGFKNLNIINENLLIDFTSYGSENLPGKPNFIDITAEYEVNNQNDISKLELNFFVLNGHDTFQVYLDNKEISSEFIDTSNYADRTKWKLPKYTPFEDKELIYSPDNGDLKTAILSFNLKKGKHTFKIKYKVRPTVSSDSGPMYVWQFAYLFAPMLDCQDFGVLNLYIKIPNDWNIFTNIKLEKNGDILSANFNEIPPDCLAISLQSPLPTNYKAVGYAFSFLFLISLFGFPFLSAKTVFHRGYRWQPKWLFGILFGILWATFVALSGFGYLYAANGLIPETQLVKYGYDGIFSFMLLIILVFAVLTVGIFLWVGVVSNVIDNFKKT